MFRIDLRPLRLDRTIDLLGELVETVAIPEAPLLFLFDEDHSYLAGIDQAVKNACTLLDAGIVDFIGVEGRKGCVREQEEERLRGEGIESLEQFIALMRLHPGAKERVLANEPKFMCRLLLERPMAPVWGVDDPDDYGKAAEEAMRILASDSYARERLQEPSELLALALEPDPQRKEELFRDMVRQGHQRLLQILSGNRPASFLMNLRQFRNELSCSGASILNVGTSEQDRVMERIRADRDYSVIRIRPDGMRTFIRPMGSSST